MNPILLKTLISLAASNKKPAPDGSVGSDAQLKNRIVLFADETVDLPDWGISGLPAMILGAAPQTCLFVSDLNVDGAPETDGTAKNKDTDKDTTSDAETSGTVSFSLTIKSPPAPESSLQARTIVWKLSLPIAGYRDVQTGANSAAVHAPVIKSRLSLGGVARDVEIGLLEMGGLDQPLLIGKDTLADKFLIRPDRPEDQKAPASPSVDLTPKPAKPADTKPASETSETSAAKPDAAPTTDSKPETQAPAKTGNEDTPADSTEPSASPAKALDKPATDQAKDSPTPDTKQDDPAQQPATPATADTNTDTTSAPDTADTADKAANPDSPSKPAEDSNTAAPPAPSQAETDTAKPAERENQPA